MNLNQLYYFRTLARMMSFRRASDELHIAQPTLSISMSKLEEELGVDLFVHEGRSIRLTKYGREYFERLDRILADLDELTRHMKRMSIRSCGNVDIGYISPLTKDFVPVNVRAFLNEPEHGQITFHFREDYTRALVDGLKNGQYDVVFCPFVKEEPSVIFVPILEQEIVAIVPLIHPLAKRESIFLRELSGYPFVAYMPQSGLRGQIDLLIAKSGLVPDVVCDASDEDGIAALVSNGFGVSCVACVASLEHRRVKILKLKDHGCSRTIYMAYLRAGQQPPSVQDFIGFIVERRLTTSDMWLAGSTGTQG